MSTAHLAFRTMYQDYITRRPLGPWTFVSLHDSTLMHYLHCSVFRERIHKTAGVKAIARLVASHRIDSFNMLAQYIHSVNMYCTVNICLNIAFAVDFYILTRTLWAVNNHFLVFSPHYANKNYGQDAQYADANYQHHILLISCPNYRFKLDL